MEPLIKSDIFFFITSVAIVVISILISIVLFYAIKAGRNILRISEALSNRYKESEEFITDLKDRLEDNWIFQFFFPTSRKNNRIKK